MTAIGEVLLGAARAPGTAGWVIEPAQGTPAEAAYRRIRHEVFVEQQGLFQPTDLDQSDEDDRRIVLVARSADGELLGGVRLAPAGPTAVSGSGPDLGWWSGSRLALSAAGRRSGGVGAALIRAACAHAESRGVIRFEATVQSANEPLFARLGWQRVRDSELAGSPHVLMRYRSDRFRTLAQSTKAALGGLLQGFNLGGPGFVGDDGVPVPGTEVIAACDAIVPAMVERDPEWAGWCSVLVNLNDLAAMGARPLGLLDALAARDASFASRILAGLRQASEAYGVPVLGGHTQLGVPAALSVTALGATRDPVPAGGGAPGHRITLTADLAGQWRPGYTGRQWDSTTSRRPAELRRLLGMVAENRPAAAKDVSMAGVVGTLGMLAEASGCAAVLDVADLPRPDAASMGDWLTCFPGFAMLTADEPGRNLRETAPATSAECGELITGRGVRLRWPDGELTEALSGPVTGMGTA